VKHSYEKVVLSHLQKVGQLPPEVQADIAKRVGTYLKLASAAETDEQGLLMLLRDGGADRPRVCAKLGGASRDAAF
jgi:hypothetical protein